MAAAWQRTLERLATTQNPTAVDLLLHALKSPDEAFRAAALSALLRRNSARANLEILRASHTFPPKLRSILERHVGTLSGAVRQALVHGDDTLRHNALQVARWAHDLHQIPVLLTLLEQPAGPLRDQVIDLLHALIDTLYAAIGGDAILAADPFRPVTVPTAGHPSIRDVSRTRHTIITALEASCQRFESHGLSEVVEWLLLLGEPQDLLTRPLLAEARSPIAPVAQAVLRTSRHPAIISLLLRLMGENYPAAWAVRTFCSRTDPEFLSQMLRFWPRRLTPFQQKNFKELTSVEWLDPLQFHLDLIPPAMHPTLVRVLSSLGVSRENRLAVLEWIVRHGSPEGRLAATELLCELEEDKVQEVVLGGLSSDQPGVQAWATSQLRAREVPHCFELLVERLDSPYTEVREAARQELQDFGVARLLETFTEIDPARHTAVGRLLLKIDPHAVQRLVAEMEQPIRRKRIRAARCALALGLHRDTVDGLAKMLLDSDVLVRRTAVEVLALIDSPRSTELLATLVDDPSPRVREEIRKALGRRGIDALAVPSTDARWNPRI
jgi:HEAT repeat protein